MKYFVPLFLILIIPSLSHSQSFQEALDYYRAENYSEAVALFSQIDDDQAILFAGKSYLSLFEYESANTYLQRAHRSAGVSSLREEAAYSLAHSYFHLKEFHRSLEYLHEIIESDNRTGLKNDARRLYFQVLDFLSREQRFETLDKLESLSVKMDLVTRSSSFLDEEGYQLLVEKLLSNVRNDHIRNEIRTDLESVKPDTAPDTIFPVAPIGTVYHIGVILPKFHDNDPEFSITRNLYFGILLAAEEFNSRNSDQKVRISFRNSAQHPDTTSRVFTELVNDHHADAIIGPLFSNPARRMASLAQRHRIPMVAPLANSEQLASDYEYTFQINSTLKLHGEAMARFAADSLQLDSIAVVIEQGSLALSAANGFRHQMEELGKTITYFIEEDFASTGYDLTETMEIFSLDSVLIDSLGIIPSQAVYAPFTGQASSTLMNLMLNDLESRRNNPVILGGIDWETAELTSFQRNFFQIFYSSGRVGTDDIETNNYFTSDYRAMFGTEPDYFSRIGYDTATYMLKSLEKAGNPVYLPYALRSGSLYRGVGTTIHFDGERINQYLSIQPLTDSARRRLE